MPHIVGCQWGSPTFYKLTAAREEGGSRAAIFRERGNLSQRAIPNRVRGGSGEMKPPSKANVVACLCLATSIVQRADPPPFWTHMRKKEKGTSRPALNRGKTQGDSIRVITELRPWGTNHRRILPAFRDGGGGGAWPIDDLVKNVRGFLWLPAKQKKMPVTYVAGFHRRDHRIPCGTR